MTERVGIRELRQNLSQWIRRVQDGESFEVTERGRTVAALVPPLQAQDPAIARLVAEGRIARIGRGSFDDLAVPDAPPGARPLSELLDEMREDEI